MMFKKYINKDYNIVYGKIEWLYLHLLKFVLIYLCFMCFCLGDLVSKGKKGLFGEKVRNLTIKWYIYIYMYV